MRKNPQSSLLLQVRIARPSDAKLIARLCRRATGPGDYVIRILNETIAERGLFLAWSGRKLVGMTKLDKGIDSSGWLSMARTDPKWQRMGVALYLQQRITEYAKGEGIRKLGLWALATNTPSIRACLKGGFKPVCESAHVSCSIRHTRKHAPAPRFTPKNRTTIRTLLQSPFLRRMNGYFAYKWYFTKVTAQLLEQLLRKGELYGDEESSFILTKPTMSFGAPYSSFTLLKGPASSILRTIRATGATFGRLWLGGYLPYNSYMLRTARKAGFKRDPWAHHCIVFEKEI